MNAKYRVRFTEYKHQWGFSPDLHTITDEFYDSYEEALNRIKQFNMLSTIHTPNWYVIPSEPKLVDLDRNGK